MIGKIRDSIIGFLYRNVLKELFFLQDPESVHDRMTAVGSWLGSTAATRKLTGLCFGFQNKMLEQDVSGVHFKNPVGLAAGFDKDAHLTGILPGVGFGFEEIGSVTGEPCQGNPAPRLWRLKKSGSLLVYYGLKNDGCEAIAAKLRGRRFAFPVGISIAKTNDWKTVTDEQGIADYVKAYKTFVNAGVGDYFTINISCPNTFGGEPFTTPEKFERLMSAIRMVPSSKPVFIKMPAEMPFNVVDGMVEAARKYRVTGFISTNLAKNRDNESIKEKVVSENGGMSGKVVQDLADKQLAYLYKRTRGEFVLVGCGGVFNAADAYKKIRLGANLIQLITGMIFQGPQVIGEINRGLVKFLKRDGFTNISQAVGADNR